MNILSLVILVFIVLETLNVLLLYFFPGTKQGNSMGFFNAYEKAKSDPEVFALLSYLVNWVAGTKLIFISLLLVIFFTGDTEVKLYSLFALILSILTFYWRLFPALKTMDQNGHLTPAGYSKKLGIMITGFIAAFTLGLIFYFIYH